MVAIALVGDGAGRQQVLGEGVVVEVGRIDGVEGRIARLPGGTFDGVPAIGFGQPRSPAEGCFGGRSPASERRQQPYHQPQQPVGQDAIAGRSDQRRGADEDSTVHERRLQRPSRQAVALEVVRFSVLHPLRE